MASNHVCPICQGASVHDRFLRNAGEMRYCGLCQLVFASPMTLPEAPELLYDRAYKGLLDDPGMKEYSQRVALRARRKKGNIAPERTLFWGAYDEALAWLKANVPRGSQVLEIGCAMGYFQAALRKNGFVPAGLDVAEEVVDTLRSEGFPVWHGTVESVPPGWQQPAVCVSFFVMHHLPDPVAFLATIRNKFPDASLLVAAWNHFPAPVTVSAASLPPRTLTWWGAHSLRRAMEKAGYEVEVVAEPIGPSEFEMPRAIRRLLSGRPESWWYYRLISVYYSIKPVIFWPWKFWKRSVDKPSTVLAVARPLKSRHRVSY